MFSRRGLSLVEILVVVAIIGLLLALLLPAVQHVREAARRAQCQNHVKQLALAVLQHEHARSHFPTGGWGGSWVGLADRGFGPEQPGGWIFNTLPYLEQDSLRELDRGLTGQARATALAERLQTPVASFHCPSRRAATAYPLVYPQAQRPRPSVFVTVGARTDYAMNAGGESVCEVADYPGPSSLAEADQPNYAWPRYEPATGISFLRSAVRMGDVVDGASNVYLLGEKQLDMGSWESGLEHGDDWTMYAGFQDDLYRTAGHGLAPRPDWAGHSEYRRNCRFGSAHAAGWHVALVDGSARLLGFDLDPTLHARLGNREDGEPASLE